MVELGVPDVKKIARGVVYGTVLTAIGRLFAPIFTTIELVFLGSQPGIFGGQTETWGIADLPVVFADLLGETAGTIITDLFGVLTDLIDAIAIQTPGPWDGLVYTILLVLLAVALGRLALLVVSAIPAIGSPLARLLEDD